MCAPARDEKLKQIGTDLENLPESSDHARNYVTIFKELLGFIDLMVKDQQELMMSQVNPIDLHRAQFQQYLNSGGNPAVLIKWLKESRNSVDEEHKNNVKIIFVNAFQKILNLGLKENLPETIPDEFLERVRMFSVEMQSISLLMSIVLLVKQAIGGNNITEPIRGILSDPGKNSSIQERIQNVVEYVEEKLCIGANEQSKRSLKSSLTELVKDGAWGNHPVLKLVNERVTKFCVNSFECAIEKQQMPGLPGIVASTGVGNDVGYVATDFVNILLQNFVTFEELYKEILKKISERSEDQNVSSVQEKSESKETDSENKNAETTS